MTTTRKILTTVMAASAMMIGATTAGFADSFYGSRNFAETSPGHAKPYRKNPNLPHHLRCQRGFYGETKCNISVNGRVYGPSAYDYSSSIGEHIQR